MRTAGRGGSESPRLKCLVPTFDARASKVGRSLISDLSNVHWSIFQKRAGGGQPHDHWLQTVHSSDERGLIVQNGLNKCPHLENVGLGITLQKKVQRSGLMHAGVIHEQVRIGREVPR